MFSRRNPIHPDDCHCCACSPSYGPADIYEAWQGVREQWVGIAIVLALAVFAAVVGCSVGIPS